MPRPKRTKVAPSKPAPRLKKVATPARAVAKAPKAFDELYDVSDPEEGTVISARRVTKGNAKEKVTPRDPVHGGEVEQDENVQDDGEDGTEAADAEPILDDIDLDSSSPAVEVGRRESALPGGDSMLAIGNFRRKARQPSILGRGAGRARSSSIESNLAYDNVLTSVQRKNTSRQRPRAGSMMGQNVLASSMGLELERGTTPNVGSALKIGRFKRREREPSVLGTAQKARQPPLDYDDDEESDFNPEGESTPLNRSKPMVASSSSAVSSGNSKKRKLSAVQVPQSSPTLPPPGAIDADESIPATGPLRGAEEEEEEEGEEGEQDEEYSEAILPSIEARAETPELHSETMAPPQSSSSRSCSPELPSRKAPIRGRRPLRGRTPPPRTQDSPVSSPPSLTHSPNRPSMVTAKHKSKKQAPLPSTLSTAQLQALLPRRRRRAAADVFSIPSSDNEVDVSGLAPEDDELSHLDIRARSRASTAISRQTPGPRKKVAKLKAPAKAAAPKGKEKRTYGRANQALDKENEEEVDPDDSLAPLPDDGNESPENSQDLEKRVGKELKQAARKFAEVDKWELEFEEVTASSSSPRDAR